MVELGTDIQSGHQCLTLSRVEENYRGRRKVVKGYNSSVTQMFLEAHVILLPPLSGFILRVQKLKYYNIPIHIHIFLKYVRKL